MGAFEVLVLALAVVATVSAGEMCAGCPVKHDPSGFSTEKLDRALSAAQVNEKVVKVLSVETQVVAGLKYKVVFESASGKTCTVTWSEIPWQFKYPVGTQISCRAKRSLLGGFQDMEDASELTDMKYMSESTLNEGTNGNRKVVVDVVKAQKKVVHGMIYKVKYVVKTTACKTEDVLNAECMSKETAPRQVCESMFFAAPFLTHGKPHVEVKSTECQAQSIASFLAAPGKLVDGHDDRDLVEAEQFAVYHVNIAINSTYYQGLYKVESVEEKMQAGGKLYNFKFQLRDTNCTKMEGLTSSENCSFTVANHPADNECSVSVWLWPYTGYKRVETSACASA